MKLRLIPLIATTFTVLSGCAALPKSISMDEGSRAALKTSRIAVVTQETPAFMFTTPTQAIVDGVLLVDVPAGKRWPALIEHHKVPDFTAAVRRTFVEDLQSRGLGYSISVSDSVEPNNLSADFSRLTEKHDAEFVLEFRTQFGGLGYGVLSWDTYQLNYLGEAVLVRMTDLKPVWKGSCSVRAADNSALTVPGDDFLKGNGELLREAAEYATQSCGQQLLAAFLSEQ
jgi:hypothetical protein